MLRRYLMYLVRWQLSTPILALCIIYFKPLGDTKATIIANFLGGILFFWVDRFIFYHKIETPLWEVKEDIICNDCGGNFTRGYRLLQAQNYDKTQDKNPQYRCEKCSHIKFKNTKVD